MRVKVRISIEVESPAPSTYPTTLAWCENVSCGGDNAKYYGDNLQKCLEEAYRRADLGLNAYVEDRDAKTTARWSPTADPEEGR